MQKAFRNRDLVGDASMRKKKHQLFDIVNMVFMLLLLTLTAYPLYYTVIASFSEASAAATGKVIWKPVGLTLEAYEQVFAYRQIWVGYLNTVIYTVLGTVFNILLTIPAAYTLSKKYLPGRRGIMTVFLITMYFGGGMVPTYLLIKSLGLINTRLVLIIVGGVSVYNLIVARVFFSSSISDSLYEAADIDGASEFRKFASIAIPLSKPILAVMVLYYAVGHWNNYFDALLYISRNNLEPLQLVLRKVLIQNKDALDEALMKKNLTADKMLDSARRAYLAYTMKYAMVFIGSAPLLIAYPFVQKYFVKGVMIGALKE